jgi:hypothetical protein
MDMPDTHLINSIRYLERNGYNVIYEGGGDEPGNLWCIEYNNPVYEALKKELEKRILPL